MKKNNKGFSLAELIVVVLILGILAVAVTPQIMTWIDKSHISKDESYAGSVSSAVETAALEYMGKGKTDEISTSITITEGAITFADGSTDFQTEVTKMFDTSKLKKPSQNGKTQFDVVISTNDTNKTVSVTTTAN